LTRQDSLGYTEPDDAAHPQLEGTTMTTPPDFDPIRYKESTRQQWEGVAEAWNRWSPTLQRWLAPVTAAMLEMARIGPGSRVLDVAGGSGEPALSAATRIGPTGYVLSTDISANLVRLALENAQAQGLDAERFEARVMDGEHLDLPDASFDAALSRLGLIYFPDRKQALLEIRRILKPGGRVVLASFTTPQANPFFSIPISIIRRRAQLPPPPAGSPGPFSLGSQEVMENAYHQAGFWDAQIRVIHAPLRLANAAECTQFEQESYGALHEMLAGVSEAEREATWQEVRQAMTQLEGPGGFESPCELLVGAAAS
jgi:ubiquinone/menaquinone biosynthesis C-methylase UbiE